MKVEGEERPRVSVVVAAYHSARMIGACLESLRGQTFREFEVIVVNSSAEEETRAVVERYPGVIFVQSAERLLPHAARNVGVERARGEYLVFTDADCCAAADWLGELVAAHEAGHEVVCGVIDVMNPTLSGAAWQLVKYAPYQEGLRSGEVAVAATGNCSYSRVAWAAAGPFDGGVMCGDALISWRARDAGMVPYFHAAAVVYDQDDGFRWGMLRQRYERGDEFGRMRSGYERWSRGRTMRALLTVPLAPLAVLLRTVGMCWRAGRMGRYAVTLPFQSVAVVCWCAGEARAYWRVLGRGEK